MRGGGAECAQRPVDGASPRRDGSSGAWCLPGPSRRRPHHPGLAAAVTWHLQAAPAALQRERDCSMSQPDGEDLLLHELRNRLNLLGFALHAYRRERDPEHLDALEAAYEAVVAAVERLDAERREGRQERGPAPLPGP